MNNNRNNRRRGRGNNRNQGGGNNANRIDSRARGNAPQLLDKYKKLAQDAQHNGDRVQAEYYLQFADHYFRVIADNKSRQDEARGKREDRDERNEEEGSEDDGDDRRQNRRSRNRDDDRQDNRGRRHRNDSDNDGEDSGGEYEPSENPFLRSDDDQPRKRRVQRKPKKVEEGVIASEGEIDVAVLPPAFSANDDGEDKPAPRRRRRKMDEDDELSAAE